MMWHSYELNMSILEKNPTISALFNYLIYFLSALHGKMYLDRFVVTILFCIVYANKYITFPL